MSITPTTPRGPSPPPPEAAELYDARHWETAYRHFDENAVPTLLLNLQDDLTRARRREAAWLSVIVHLTVIILFVNQPKLESFYRRTFLHQRPVMRVWNQDLIRQKELTYLELPPDLQKVTKRPDSNVISDKDRVATTRTPQLDPKELRKLFASNHPGTPEGMQGRSNDQGDRGQATQQNSVAPSLPNAPQQAEAQSAPAAPRGDNQLAQLQAPPAEKPQVKFGTEVYAGSAIDQAAHAASAQRGGYGGDGGDFGLSRGKSAGALGQAEILTDTMGVDFGPYLSRILHDIRENWYRITPESADVKKGWVTIDFYILKDGSYTGMKKVASSGDVTLERPAWGAIRFSAPFPPLPKEFPGQDLGLRLIFLYHVNPDGSDPDAMR